MEKPSFATIACKYRHNAAGLNSTEYSKVTHLKENNNQSSDTNTTE